MEQSRVPDDRAALAQRLDDERWSRRRADALILLFLALGSVVTPLAHVLPAEDDGFGAGILRLTWDAWTFVGPEGGYDVDGTTATMWLLRIGSLAVVAGLAGVVWLAAEMLSPGPLDGLRRLTTLALVALSVGAVLVGGILWVLGDEAVDLARGWWFLPVLAGWTWHVRADPRMTGR